VKCSFGVRTCIGLLLVAFASTSDAESLSAVRLNGSTVAPGGLLLTSTPPARNWATDPSIVELDVDEDLYAVGDVHGDYKRLIRSLVAGGIVPEQPEEPSAVRWNAGKAVLVCPGDLINKGDHSLKVIALFRALQKAAAQAGGRVIVSMGNHEAEFLANPKGDKVAEFVEELNDAELQPDDVAAGRDEAGIGQFLRSMPLAVRVNDWFFSHAGNTRGRTLRQLRNEVQDGIDAHGYRLDGTVPALDALLNDRLHPFPWWQQREVEDPATSRARLEGYVRALGVKHLVVGHQNGRVKFSDGTQRERGEMYQKFDGLVFMIDVGMSRAIDRSEGALLRVHGHEPAKATVLYPDGRKERLWPAP
jgi:Calcineurin-like phosphoesterase